MKIIGSIVKRILDLSYRNTRYSDNFLKGEPRPPIIDEKSLFQKYLEKNNGKQNKK